MRRYVPIKTGEALTSVSPVLSSSRFLLDVSVIFSTLMHHLPRSVTAHSLVVNIQNEEKIGDYATLLTAFFFFFLSKTSLNAEYRSK